MDTLAPKSGLDDYLIRHSVADLDRLPVVEPFPPNVRGWLRDELAQPKKLDRNGVQICARAVSGSLLNRGSIYKDPGTGRFYYYCDTSHELHEFELGPEALRQLNTCSLGTLLHREYGLGAADQAVLGRAFENLAHSPRLRLVSPRRVSYAAPDALYYQLSDALMVRVSAERIDILPNGTDDVLFHSGQVQPIDAADLQRLIDDAPDPLPWVPLWLGAVEELSTLQPLTGLSLPETRLFLAALCYLNPWFRRWRGLALPIEIFCAEAASGKSYAYKLRRGILTGSQRLDHLPSTQGDWQVAITHAPGMWVCDNVDLIHKELERTFSDELCHYVTEDDPMISIRKLHVTNVQYRSRVDCSFAFTCIKNPFHKPDIIQRAFTFHLKAIPEEKRDSSWVDRKLADRTIWIYDQLRVSQEFLRAARDHWRDEGDRSTTRLKHFDQALHLMGIALGRSEEMDRLIPRLKQATSSAIAEADPAMSALREWSSQMAARGLVGRSHRRGPAAVRENLLLAGDRFEHVRVLRSVEAFGKYLAQHETDIRNSCGIVREREGNQTWLYVTEEQ